MAATERDKWSYVDVIVTAAVAVYTLQKFCEQQYLRRVVHGQNAIWTVEQFALPIQNKGRNFGRGQTVLDRGTGGDESEPDSRRAWGCGAGPLRFSGDGK